ncbi:MAG: 6-bladed beta-propeller [Betaproteobacteria bacterium]|nr:6-bladed beta-propeller [Betaproteobacteria bacterium]
MRIGIVVAFALILAGCAGDAKRVLKFDLADTPRAQRAVFPSVSHGDIPRYVYIGDLVGEQNFVLANPADESTLMKVLKWIAGIFDDPLKSLVRPQSIAVDGQGRILVSDVGKNAIYVFDEPNGRLDIWEFATRLARFASPSGIAIGPMGRIFVADSELATVFLLDPQGKSVPLIGADQLARPTGLAFDADEGELYVSDTGAHQIKVFDVTGRLLRTLGERGDEPGQFNYPTYIALRGNRLVVADTLNARIQVLTLDGSAKPLVIGRRGTYFGDFVRPKGVAFDDEDNIYAIESYFDHLLIFNDKGRFLLPIGGTGTGPGRFFLPAGVHIDGGSRVFVADTFNGRVAVFQFLGGGEDD